MDSVLHEELGNIAQSKGLKQGQYTIKVVREHEFLYRGVEIKVTIAVDRNNGEDIFLKILKRPTTRNNELKIPWNNCFFNNVHYYDTVQPILKTYGSVPMTPKYYGSSLKKGEEYLILEDLERSNHYKKFAPSPGLNRQTVKEVIKMLAHFHCTVRLWRTRAPGEFQTVCGQFKPFLCTNYPYKEELRKYEKMMREMIKAVWMMGRHHGHLDFRGTIEKVLPNIGKLVANALKCGSEVEDQQWSTLVNCFACTPNFLFKLHTVSGAVIDVGLEDWSAARLGSPVLDLALLLFSSCAQDLYSDMNGLINEYFSDSVSAVEIKERHIPRFGVYGVFGGIAVNIAWSIQDKLETRLDLITAKELADDSFKSNSVPDIKARLLAILKAAVESKIL